MAQQISGKTAGGIAGGAFTAVVVGLLLFLHLGGKVEVPRFAEPLSGAKRIYLCKGAPAWVALELADAQAFWKKHGAVYGTVEKNADCPATCQIDGRAVACHEGAITIDLRDQAFDQEAHAGETLWVKQGERLRWVTLLLPDKIEPPEGGASLPKDINALVLTHEMGHAEGLDHSLTRISKGAISHKTGEVMNPATSGLGWGAAGLP